MTNEIPDIPPDMRKVFRRLRRWRSSHRRRAPLPDSLWAAAGELGNAEPGLVGRRGTIQIAPQMRILVGDGNTPVKIRNN
jgi:hypothetical protein